MRESTALTIFVASQRKEGSSQEVNRLNVKCVFSGSNKDGTARGTIWFKGDSKAKPIGDCLAAAPQQSGKLLPLDHKRG